MITIDSPSQHILRKKADEIAADEFGLAREIVEKLLIAIQPHVPAASLAAPQIGIGKAVFIYSFDRDPKNLEAVVNPRFVPVGDTKVESWEACLVILGNGNWKSAKISRYETVHVSYLNLEGKKVEKRLEGFAAKVFSISATIYRGLSISNAKTLWCSLSLRRKKC